MAAEKHKEEGNKFFAKGDYKKAAECYSLAIKEKKNPSCFIPSPSWGSINR